MKKLGIEHTKGNTRTDVCNKIEERMLFLEKYATTKDKNKVSYVLIPIDHPDLPFPYNLEDRVDNILNKLKTQDNGKNNML